MRPRIDGSNSFVKAMEDAISTFRGAAKKTFEFTKPGELFKGENDTTGTKFSEIIQNSALFSRN